MCKSKADGGQRCAAHTRPRFEAATFGTAEWDEAAAEYASTASGEMDIAEQAVAATMGDDVERSVALFSALERGRDLRALNTDTAAEVRTQELIVAHEHRMRLCDDLSAQIAQRHDIDSIPIERWHERKMCVFDLETTAKDPLDALTVTASIVEVYGNPDNPDNIVVREWAVNPGIPIPEASRNVHGISDADAQANGLPPAYVVRQLNAFLAAEQAKGVPIVAYNGTYDLVTLQAESQRHGLTPDETLGVDGVVLVDPMVIDKGANPYAKGGRTLKAVAARVAGVEEFDAHNSSADCIATAKVAHALAQNHPQIQVDPRRLMGWQRAWDERWATKMTDWLRSKGEMERSFEPSFGLVPSSRQPADEAVPAAASA